LDAAASSEVFRGIEKNVVSRSEISVIFDKFDINNEKSEFTKSGIFNLYYFMCSLACAEIREGPKEKFETIFGLAATHFLNILEMFESKNENRVKFLDFVPKDWNDKFPKLFLDYVKTEQFKTSAASFLGAHKFPPDLDPIVATRFFWGFKIWKISQENRLEINTKLNKLYVAPADLKSGASSYLFLF